MKTNLTKKIKNIVKVLIIIFISILIFIFTSMKKAETIAEAQINVDEKIETLKKKLEENKTKKQEKCKETLKELDIPNTCDEVSKIIREFGNDKIFVAVILHESNFDRSAVNVNKDGSIDRGIFQLNSNYWGGVDGNLDNSIAKAKQCLKDNGLDCFWAYRNGSYLKHLDNADKLLEAIN